MDFRWVWILFIPLSWSMAEPVRNLAVLDFPPSEGVSSSELQLIAARLETELIQTKAFQVLERRRMGDILQEQGLQNTGICSGDGCEVRMGQLLGVDRIVTGSLGKVGKVYSLNLKLVDVSTGSIDRSEAIDVEGGLSEVVTKSCRIIARRFANLEEERLESSAWKWWLAGGAGLAAIGTVTYILLQPEPEKESEVIRQDREIK